MIPVADMMPNTGDVEKEQPPLCPTVSGPDPHKHMKAMRSLLWEPNVHPKVEDWTLSGTVGISPLGTTRSKDKKWRRSFTPSASHDISIDWISNCDSLEHQHCCKSWE